MSRDQLNEAATRTYPLFLTSRKVDACKDVGRGASAAVLRMREVVTITFLANFSEIAVRKHLVIGCGSISYVSMEPRKSYPDAVAYEEDKLKREGKRGQLTKRDVSE